MKYQLLISIIVLFVGKSHVSNAQTEIWDWEDLHSVRTNLAGDYTLMDDLDESTAGYSTYAGPSANSGAGWEPIGRYVLPDFDEPFTGTFNGNGHTITGLFINRPSTDKVGLFGYVHSGGIVVEIANVGLLNVNITGQIGVGGLVGHTFAGHIYDCYVTGSVAGTSDVGGLMGYVSDSEIHNSHAVIDVLGSSSSTGGLVGWITWGNVYSCFATGNVSGNNYTGGLIGGNNFGNVYNSYATGTVTGNQYVGGLTGTNRGQIHTSYAVSTVFGNVGSTGGFVGGDEFGSGSLSNSYWNPDIAGQTQAIGDGTNVGGITSLSITEMRQQASFSGWDFSSIWSVNEGGSFPWLQNNAQVPPPEYSLPFITTWKTDNPGTSGSNQITIPTTGGGYNYGVYWEKTDNASINGSHSGQTGSVTITFPEVGIYRVEISGDFPRIFFNMGGDRQKILTVQQWGEVAWSSMDRAFRGCTNLTVPATDAPDLQNVTTTNLMFQSATSFNQDISNWNTSSVENMSSMFSNASAFNQDISGWDVSNVTNMFGVFFGAGSFNQDIGGWDVSTVTNMSFMFSGASLFNQNIGGWDVSSAITMEEMLNNSGLSTANYDATLTGWAAQTLQPNVTLGATGLNYCDGAAARITLTNAPNNWIITGDVEECPIIASLTYTASPDISTAVFSENFSVSAQDGTPKDIAFNIDGTKMYVMGFNTTKVHEYNLSDPFEITSAVYSKNFTVAAREGLAFNNNGTKMYAVGSSFVYEYTLATAFDIGTASSSASFSIAAKEVDASGVQFSQDGTRMFVVGFQSVAVHTYLLSIPFGISSAVFSNSFSVGAQDSNPSGLAFSKSGRTMYVVGQAGREIHEYNLATAFDVSSATFSTDISVSANQTMPNGIAFDLSGTRMYVSGVIPAVISAFDLSAAYNETVANDGAVDGSIAVVLLNGTFTNAGGTLTSPAHFTISNLPVGLVPTIAVSGDGSTGELTLSGNATAHSKAASVSSLEFTFQDAAFTSGDAAATINAVNASSGMGISFNDSPPIITTFTPASGTVGTEVTITGTDFNTTPANNIVIFGATAATVTAASATELTVTVPTGATYAPLTVLDVTTGLLAYSTSSFTPTFTPGKGTITPADFSPKVDFATGSIPRSVAIGDLDGDGKADLAVANHGSNTVSVFRNTGSPGTISYASKADFAAGSSPRSVAIGDLDGDGKADLAVVNNASNTVSVLRNTGSPGTISYAPKTDLATGSSPHSVAIGDLDGDGKADLVVANSSSNTISVFRNTGSPATISYAAKIDLATGSNPHAIAIGDLDGDGKPDLVVTNYSSHTLSIFRNTGSPGIISYVAKVDFTTGSSPFSVAIGDLDGDGKGDLVVTNFGSNTVSVLLNTGSPGTLGYAAKVDFAMGSAPVFVATGDLDGDGKVDLAVTNSSNTVSVFHNTGSPGTISYAAKVDFPTGVLPYSVAIGDLDGDGKADLAIANYSSNTISIIRNNPLPPPPSVTAYFPNSGPVSTEVTITGTGFNTTPLNNIVIFGATAATVTAASSTELTVTVPTGATYAPVTVLDASTGLLGYSTSRFTPTFSPNKGSITPGDFSPKIDFATGTNPFSVAIGDLDGDGKADLAVGSSSAVSVLINTSTPGTTSYATKVDFSTGGSALSVAIGDLDGDGKPDLAVATGSASSTVSVFRNTGSPGSISYAPRINFYVPDPHSVAIGDLDGDGRADLVVTDYSGNRVSVFRNTGNPGTISFAAKVDFTTGTNPRSVAIGDLDGDGKADMAVSNQSSNSVSVFRNTSSPGIISYALKVDFTTGSTPVSIAIGDLDGDSKADMAVANNSSSTVSVFRNTGSTGTIGYAAKVDFTTGSSPFTVALGDLDGDGKADLAVSNTGSATVSVLRNTGSPGTISYVAKADFMTGISPYSVAIGDLDGDGKADLAVANSNTVSVLRNNPVFPPQAITSFLPISGPVGTSVTIIGTDFNTTPANNIVIFGATAANVTAATETEITVTVPTGATYAPITVLDITTGLLAYSTTNFTPTFAPSKGSIIEGDFSPKVDITSSNPYSVAIGDLDGDGRGDLAVANGNSSLLSVFLNTSSAGTVSYAPKVDFTTGTNPSFIAIGDLDGDGKADLAVANYDGNSVSVLRNTGSVGAISYATKIDYTTGTNPSSVAIGDLDGDGKADLAVANDNSNTVSLFRNTSTIVAISYAAKVDLATGANPIPVSIGDLDGDGKADLAVANFSNNNVSVFRNTSSPGIITYAPKVDFTTGTGPVFVAVGDLDGDSKADLAVTNYTSNTVSILRSTGSAGTVSFATKIDFPTGSIPRSVSIGDLNGDGKADLAVANLNSNTVSVFRNTGSTGFVSFVPKVDLVTGATPRYVAIGDLDGDGKSDMAVANVDGNTVSIFRNNPAFPPSITSFTPTSGPVGTTVTITGANFNITAANNIVIFGATAAIVTNATATELTVTVPTGATYAPTTVLDVTSGLLSYSTGNFTPTFSPGKGSITEGDLNPKIDFTTGANPFSVSIGDIDGDGKADVVVANSASNTISIFRNTSTSGTVSYAAKVDLTTGTLPRIVSIGDIDGDGKPDLAVANQNSNTVSLFRNTSTSGIISFAAKVDFTTASGPRSIVIGDVDGDGKPDLAVLNQNSNTVSVLRNTSAPGTVTFAAKVDFATGSAPFSISIGDIDGDGKPDLAVANFTANSASVLRNTSTPGSASFAAKVDFTTATGPSFVRIEDIDGDGLPELAVANNGSNSISAFRNTSTPGAVSFAAKVDFTTGTNPYSISFGDLNGDGKPDLAVANNGGGGVSVLRNASTAGTVSFAPKIDFTTGTNPTSVSIGDIDGDGKPDLAVTNLSSNTVSIFRNKPVFPPSITSFTPTSGLVGTTVTITGANFNTTPANNIVIFGATAATVTAATATELTVTVPTGATYAPITVLDVTKGLLAYTTSNFTPIFAPSKGSITSADFSPNVDFATGANQISVAIGDLDGDGKADLAVVNTSNNTVSVFRNTGSSGTVSYAAKVDFTTGTNPISIAISDLDGDGKVDLAVANQNSNSVSVFRNTGTPGTISYAAKIDFTTGSNPTSVAITDLDGDGKADLVVTNYSSNTVSIFPNTGSPGILSYAAKVDLTTGSHPRSVAIGDLDGDGKSDLAVANYSSSTVSVFRNAGSPGFISFASKVDLTAGPSPASVAIGDLDGDGKADLAVADIISSNVSVFRNTGSPGAVTYAAKVDFTTGTSPHSVAISDLDGDGKADLAIANQGSGTVSVLRNTSSPGTISCAAKVDFTTGASPYSVAIGDLDGDGKADLAIAKNSLAVAVIRNNPVFSPPTITSFAPNAGTVGTSVTITGTNFNSTPSNNVVIFGATQATVTTASSTELTVTVPTGATYAPITVLEVTTGLLAYTSSSFTPTFTPSKGSITTSDFSPKLDFASGTLPHSVAIGDLDGDGKADLAVANYSSNTVSVFRNTSTLGITNYATKVDFATGTGARSVAIGDLDGDGKVDLAVVNQINSTVSVFRNTGSPGTIGYATKIDFATSTLPVSVAIGDLDGDGKADLAVASYLSNTVSVFRNTGSPGTVSYAAKVDFTTGALPFSVAMRDLDGDGKADLVVANYDNNSVSVFRNTCSPGSVSFAAKIDFATGTNPYSVAIGDLDGDGKADLAVTNSNGATVSVVRNTGSPGTIGFATKVDFTTGSAARSVAIGDLDGDGKADLAVANTNSNTVSAFRNTGSPGIISYAPKVDFTTGSNPLSVAIGDLDGDGKPDLAIANEGSSTVSVLRNNQVFAPFITTWVTTNNQVTILTTGGGYNYSINWSNLTNTGVGNGSIAGRTGNYTITGLANGDTYQVEIIGDFPRIYMIGNAAERTKLQSIDQWGDIAWTSMEDAFYGCSNLVYNADDSPDLSEVSNMSDMFNGASLFDGDIGGWNVSQVTDMSRMFLNATSFNQDIGGWDVSNVVSTASMFFQSGSFNQDIGAWDVSSVTDMASMFFRAHSFNQDIGSWNVSSVVNLSGVFREASSFNQDISGWNVSHATNMAAMFLKAHAFNQNIGSWDVANVTGMGSMFDEASSFNQDISNWDVSSVTSMAAMFRSATAFNQDISDWTVASVTNMNSMFNGASSFDQNIGTWAMHNATTVTNMLSNCGLSRSNYDNTLIGWASQTLQTGRTLGANELKYCDGAAARNILTSAPNNWTITGDDMECEQIITFNAFSDKTYGDADFELTATASSGLDVSYVSSNELVATIIDNTLTIHATGTTTITASQPGNDDYLPAEDEEQELTILPRAITVAADALQKNYGDDDPALTYTITAGDLVGTDEITGALVREAGEDVDTYGILQNTITAGDNYSLTYVGADFTIAARPITVTADTQSKTYGDVDPALTYNITSGNLVGTDELTGELNREAGEDAGDYEILQNTLSAGSNYALTYIADELTISTRPITITADAQSKTYGDPDPALTYNTTSGNLVGTDALTGELSRETGEDTGDYEILQNTLTAGSNYALTYVSEELTISTRPITITADTQSKIYGDADPALTYVITSGSLAGVDEITGALSREAGEGAGTYEILQGTVTAGSNYALTYVADELTISTRPISITADAQSKTYGDADPALTYNIASGNLVGSDQITGALNRETGEDVGDYEILQNTLTAGNNYVLTYVADELTISSRPITVTTNAQSKAYGQVDPALTYTITSGSLAGSDVLTGILSRLPGESVGTYEIQKNTLAAGSNYMLTYITADLTITKATISATADDKSKSFGEVNPGLTISYAGFEFGEDVSVLDQLPEVSTSAAATSDAGLYPIELSGGLDDNYNFELINGTLTINKVNQTITFGPLEEKSVGDPDFVLSATASSGLAVTFASSNTTVATVSGNVVTIVAAGETLITASQPGNQNYNAASDVVQSLVVVSPQTSQTITFNSIEDVVMGSPPLTLIATATSGLPVSFLVVSGPATVAGNTLTITGMGTIVVRASQEGNTTYLPAVPVEVSFCSNPPKPTITLQGAHTQNPTLVSSAPNGNQWLLGGDPIDGATSNTYVVDERGLYRVQVTVNGCSSEISTQFALVITGDISPSLAEITAYPNPATDRLVIAGIAYPVEGVQAIDGSGRMQKMSYQQREKELWMNVDDLASGLYMFRVVTNGGVYQLRIAKN